MLLASCGGGSSGTGVGAESYKGVVLSSDGSPIGNAAVTLSETGDTATTNSDGTFTITSDAGLPSATFLIETSSGTSTVVVNELQGSAQSITIAIDEKTASNQVAKAFDIRVKIIGACDPFFENTRPIRQANAVATGTVCRLRISLRSSSGGLANRAYQLQSNGCSLKAPWNSLISGNTDATGVAEVNFAYDDSRENCIYRVLTPLNDNQISPLSFEILTSTYQLEKAKK